MMKSWAGRRRRKATRRKAKRKSARKRNGVWRSGRRNMHRLPRHPPPPHLPLPRTARVAPQTQTEELSLPDLQLHFIQHNTVTDLRQWSAKQQSVKLSAKVCGPSVFSSIPPQFLRSDDHDDDDLLEHGRIFLENPRTIQGGTNFCTDLRVWLLQDDVYILLLRYSLCSSVFGFCTEIKEKLHAAVRLPSPEIKHLQEIRVNYDTWLIISDY